MDNMNNYENLATVIVQPRLHEILNKRGITQHRLSELSGVSQGTISRFDKSAKHVDWHIFAIADALNLSVSDLFEVYRKEKRRD